MRIRESENLRIRESTRIHENPRFVHLSRYRRSSTEKAPARIGWFLCARPPADAFDYTGIGIAHSRNSPRGNRKSSRIIDDIPSLEEAVILSLPIHRPWVVVVILLLRLVEAYMQPCELGNNADLNRIAICIMPSMQWLRMIGNRMWS